MDETAQPVSLNPGSGRKKSLFFLVFVLLLSAGIIVWNFYIDYGKIAIKGTTPFTINIGKIHDFLCGEPVCELKLKPKKYTLLTKKQSYFDFSRKVEIKRWKKIEVEAVFEFIPVIKELGELKLPFESLKINLAEIPLDFDWQKIDTAKIPRNSKKIIFAPNGEEALVFLGREKFLFDKSVLIPFSIPDFDDIAWDNFEHPILFLLSQKLNDGSQKLFSIKIEKPDELNIIANFERPLQNGKIINAEGDDLFIIDNSEIKRVYKISKSKKTKNRVQIEEKFQNLKLIKWGVFAYGIKQNSHVKVLLNIDGKIKEIPAVSSDLIVLSPLSDEKLIFVSYSKAGSQAPGEISLQEALDIAKQNLASANLEKYLYFVEYDIKIDAFKDLASIKYDGEIDLMQASDGKILFLKNNKVFALLLAEQ